MSGTPSRDAWESDFAVPRWAKPLIRRGLRRLERDVRLARTTSPDLETLHGAVSAAGARFARAVNRTMWIRPWVETMNRDQLFDAVTAVVLDETRGFRGDVDELVESAGQGIEQERDW